MARTQDRWLVSEAIRTQPLRNNNTPLWTVFDRHSTGVVLASEYDEKLFISYNRTGGGIKVATYIHYDEHGVEVSRVVISTDKRKRVLHLIKTGRFEGWR